MSGKDSDLPVAFKKFVSEDEIEEKRKQRQEEWERVRTADQPMEAPEEEYDHRSLFERLQEQKQKKDDEHDEKYRLSNMVKGLEDDEAQFLDFVSDKQEEVIRARERENEEALAEYKSAVMNLAATSVGKKDDAREKTKSQKSAMQTSKRSQSQLLAGAVKRKSTDTNSNSEDLGKKSRVMEETGPSGDSKNHANANGAESASRSQSKRALQQGTPQVAKVIGILPGMGYYTDSSDSEDSSASENEDNLEREVATVAKVKGTVKSCEQSTGGGGHQH